MIDSNPIHKLFHEVLAQHKDKKLISLRPRQTKDPRQWSLPFIFDDGTEIEVRTEFDNAEFKKVWDEFWHWFDRIRMAEIEEQQQNPE